MTWLTLLKKGGPYLVVLAVIAGIAFGGWTARGWYEGKKDLAALKAAQAAIDAAMARESDIAQAVEEKLANLKANQTVIDRGVIREVVKPVYQRVCFEPDLVRMLNLESGEALPADLTGQVPGDADKAD
ncbi:hypothetical protein [Alcanivorax sp.]|uniref:hypothetical protein n=1 Tax=Alcanivorax sp. TaxID=1872427 RepID=UPI003A8CB1A9